MDGPLPKHSINRDGKLNQHFHSTQGHQSSLLCMYTCVARADHTVYVVYAHLYAVTTGHSGTKFQKSANN